MKKALVVMAVLAIIAPANAGNLLLEDAIPWGAPTGDPPWITDLGGGVINLDIISDNGGGGLFWRLPAVMSETVSVTGEWWGDTGGSGWAEVMFFTSTEGLSDIDVANRIDVGNPGDIAAKHDSWGMNGPPAFGPEPIETAPHPAPGGNFEIQATCAEAIVAFKVGNTANVTFDVSYIPEPASAMLLLLGGLPFLRRRRIS